MTTIKYMADGEVRLTGIRAFALMTPDELNYLVGELPPHYPVPTTMGTVHSVMHRGKVLDINLNCADNTMWWPEEQWSYDD